MKNKEDDFINICSEDLDSNNVRSCTDIKIEGKIFFKIFFYFSDIVYLL